MEPFIKNGEYVIIERTQVARNNEIVIAVVDGKGECLEGEVEMDESYFGSKRKGKRGRGAEGKIPVFGILESDGRVKVEVVKDVTSESLLKLAINKVKKG